MHSAVVLQIFSIMSTKPKGNLEPEPEGEPARTSFKFFAVANTDLQKGELMEFSVDSTGKVASPKLDFIYNTPRIARVRPGS